MDKDPRVSIRIALAGRDVIGIAVVADGENIDSEEVELEILEVSEELLGLMGGEEV